MNDKEHEARRDSFIKAAEPLMEWLSDNAHPHSHVVVTSIVAELSEGVLAHNTEKFLKD